ncbi:hypothetical protein GCM10011514_49350 [Emticicia aquatilis]|uniref:Calcineurin-like phosphoesterase domain-containing protein n=1 Tax=Emticicia aquatilis TaxID=1537369 RepID=A0A917DYQ9_9BACT|nr:metallophosphoesterase [Emticicia aquatilis]GGD79506.1 hypothetical protein GCM10011514_49350 [Emticicia aquatilis]
MKLLPIILFFLLVANIVPIQAQKNAKIFVVEPYLQIGYNPSPESLQVLWHTNNSEANWSVEVKVDENASWIKMPQPLFTKVAVANTPPHYVFHASMNGLKAGHSFEYKVLKDGNEVFISSAKAPVSASKPYRFVAFGDIGAETAQQKMLAVQAYKANPDFVVVPGDIVYDRGLISEYRKKFFPIYNSDVLDTTGSPLMRKVPMITAPGNHDIETRDLNKYPDALAYYYYWQNPLNGMQGVEGGAIIPNLTASTENREAFMQAGGSTYFKMANYSFNYGNAHWLIIDSNNYVDYTDKPFVSWIENDLNNANDVTWKFVMFHHPGFNSSIEHYEQQQTRLLAPIFEKAGVDIVINGHVHNYQRSFPLKFIPDGKGVQLVGGMGNKFSKGRIVNGSWKLDKKFNGKTITKPNGIIYLITGAGGNDLYNPEQETDKDSWQGFTSKFISTKHSLTIADVNGPTIVFKQIDKNGKLIDTFKVTK